MTLQHLNFTRDDSMVIRGVAILTMVCHHALPSPVCKICVGLFTFLVGYGYWFNRPPEWRNNLHRAWRLLSSYWLILFLLILPTALIWGGYRFSLPNFVLNSFGLLENLNWYSWYVAFYLYAMISMPLYSRIIRRWPVPGTLAVILFGPLVVLIMHFIPGRPEMWTEMNIYAWFTYTPLLAVGYLFAEKRWIEKLCVPADTLWRAVPLIILVLLFLTRSHWGFVLFDIVYVPVMVVAVLWLVMDCQIKIIPKTLKALGVQSMNIWFLHSLFFCNYTAYVWSPLIDWVPQGYLQVLWIIILCYPLGMILDALHKLLGNLVDRIPLHH